MGSQFKISVIIFAILGAILLTVAIMLKNNNQMPLTHEITNQPTIGSASAVVNVVVLEDLKCPACKNYSLNVLPKIKSLYIDTNKIQYTTLLVAFLPGSETAGNCAYCMYEQNHDFFYPFIDWIYQNQPPENTPWTSINNLIHFATHIPGVNENQLRTCLDEGRHSKMLYDNLEQMTKLSVAQTPTMFVNGQNVSPLTIENVSNAIDKALKSKAAAK